MEGDAAALKLSVQEDRGVQRFVMPLGLLPGGGQVPLRGDDPSEKVHIQIVQRHIGKAIAPVELLHQRQQVRLGAGGGCVDVAQDPGVEETIGTAVDMYRLPETGTVLHRTGAALQGLLIKKVVEFPVGQALLLQKPMDDPGPLGEGWLGFDKEGVVLDQAHDIAAFRLFSEFMIRWTLSNKPDNCLLLYRLYIEYGKTARAEKESLRTE